MTRHAELASSPKQVIVMRKDLNMRKGKMIAQGAHASIMFLANATNGLIFSMACLPPVQREWLNGRFTKVCVSVDSEEELLAIHAAAQAADVVSSLVQDAGLTEFGGVPTLTCLALGPDYPECIDPITGHLKLL